MFLALKFSRHEQMEINTHFSAKCCTAPHDHLHKINLRCKTESAHFVVSWKSSPSSYSSLAYWIFGVYLGFFLLSCHMRAHKEISSKFKKKNQVKYLHLISKMSRDAVFDLCMCKVQWNTETKQIKKPRKISWNICAFIYMCLATSASAHTSLFPVFSDASM